MKRRRREVFCCCVLLVALAGRVVSANGDDTSTEGECRRPSDETTTLVIFSATSNEVDGRVLLSWHDAATIAARGGGGEDDEPLAESAAPLDVLERLLRYEGVEMKLGTISRSMAAAANASGVHSGGVPWPADSTPLTTLENIDDAAIQRALELSAAPRCCRSFANARFSESMAVNTEELLFKTLLDRRWYERNVRPTHHHASFLVSPPAFHSRPTSIQIYPTNVTFGFLLNQVGVQEHKLIVLHKVFDLARTCQKIQFKKS